MGCLSRLTQRCNSTAVTVPNSRLRETIGRPRLQDKRETTGDKYRRQHLKTTLGDKWQGFENNTVSNGKINSGRQLGIVK